MTEQAEIRRGSRISAVWFIPLLAVGLGVYMFVHNLLTQGPEIEIAFKTADGLEEGKTRIKFREVDIGTVNKVRLNERFDGVIASATLDRQAEALLREDTRFWVVTAQVGVDNISGLETLLSGAYIQLSPGSGPEGYRQFTGLEEPPLTPADARGLRLKLSSDSATSLNAGDAVLFNGYKVGRVDKTQFDIEERVVHYDVFIDAPFDELVNSAVRFWDVSGISLNASAEGFELKTGSIDTVLLGGIAFTLPEGVPEGEPVENGVEFKLHSSYEEILEQPFRHGTYYVLQFTQSIKGLMPGAAVEFRGIPVGRVERLLLRESVGTAMESGAYGQGIAIPVLVYLEPARMELPDRAASLDILRESIANGIDDGLRASLESGNLLTGSKFVNLDYFSDVQPVEPTRFLDYPTIPTVDTGLGQLQQQVSSILTTIDSLPLDQTVDKANAAIGELNSALAKFNTLLAQPGTRELPDNLDATLEEVRSTLQGLSPGSGLYESLNSSLLRLNRTLGNLESVTDTLASKPNAVLLPSKSIPDPVPEARE